MNHHTPSATETWIARTPWQLWVVVVLLATEGIGNLFAIAAMPVAAVWLAAKLLFIVGLIRRWRIVFLLFIACAALHVLAFAVDQPFAALLNLLIVVLAVSQFRNFFPSIGSPEGIRQLGRA